MYAIQYIYVFSVELKKLEGEGFGRYVGRNLMQKDKLLPANACLSVFIKRDIVDLPEKFFSFASNSECTQDMYVANYDKKMDQTMKRIAAYYHKPGDRIVMSIESNMSESKQL